jgi:pimeloyl-ACP methyl ester carboxylesterase
MFPSITGCPETLIGQSPMTSVNVFFAECNQSRRLLQLRSTRDGDHALAAGALTAMLNWYRAAFRRRTGSPARPSSRRRSSSGAKTTRPGKSLTYGLETWVPNLKIHYIPNCGHWVQNEAPDEVNAQLLEFIK